MKVERRELTKEEWRSITSERGGRRGVRAAPGILRALKDRSAEEIDRIRDSLLRNGRLCVTVAREAGASKAAERWYAA